VFFFHWNFTKDLSFNVKNYKALFIFEFEKLTFCVCLSSAKKRKLALKEVELIILQKTSKQLLTGN